jgi:DNA invertase Pin-like site-specific DNA recombinase
MMTKAALYARVSSDAQQKEGTIESQVAELKRQIAAAGHVLVKQYIDDGVPGPLLDRPALNRLREDAKGNVYDVVYFLDADRIARVVAYQTIIIEELLKCGKKIIIKGQNYADNPENKFTLQMLGAVAEYEHAKIIERTTRGRLHRLRQGELTSTGHRIFGYDYVRKTPTSPCALIINEDQAAIPLTGVHSPVDFTVSKGRPIQAKPSADVQPVFDTPVDRRDHKLRLDLCRTTASSLLKMLEQQRFNVREGYSQALRDYIRYLPPNTRKRNLLFADQEARILRDLFAEDAAVLPVDFASRLKATLQAHMALRVFYPVVKRFYDDVRFGRAEPLPIDAADNITALVREAPEIFDPSVGQALADAAPPLPASSATFPPNETRTLEPPPDLLGTLPTEKAQGYLRAGVINRLFAAFQKGEVLNKNAEAWAKMGERLLPYVREVIEWLASFLPGPPT